MQAATLQQLRVNTISLKLYIMLPATLPLPRLDFLADASPPVGYMRHSRTMFILSCN